MCDHFRTKDVNHIVLQCEGTAYIRKESILAEWTMVPGDISWNNLTMYSARSLGRTL